MINVIEKSLLDKAYLTLYEVAEFLGLKYHHARKILLNDTSIGHYDYAGKRLWAKTDIIAFRDNHYRKPNKEDKNGSI